MKRSTPDRQVEAATSLSESFCGLTTQNSTTRCSDPAADRPETGVRPAAGDLGAAAARQQIFQNEIAALQAWVTQPGIRDVLVNGALNF